MVRHHMSYSSRQFTGSTQGSAMSLSMSHIFVNKHFLAVAVIKKQIPKNVTSGRKCPSVQGISLYYFFQLHMKLNYPSKIFSYKKKKEIKESTAQKSARSKSGQSDLTPRPKGTNIPQASNYGFGE